MTFFEILKNTEAEETKRTVLFKADGNGVKIVNKTLINLEKTFNDSNLQGVLCGFDRGMDIATFYMFTPCVNIGDISRDREIAEGVALLVNFKRKFPDISSYINTLIDNGSYIKNDALKVLEESGNKELLQKAIRYKQGILEERRAEEQKETEKREAEEAAAVEAQKAEQERAKAEKLSFLCGYGNSKTQIQVERLYNILSKLYFYNGNYMTRKDFIIKAISEGGRIERKDGIITYYGSKWNPKQSKPKTEYRLYISENSYYAVTKTEYDFANYIINKAV